MNKVLIIKQVDVDELKKQLYNKIDMINKKKDKANIDYIRVQLEKAVNICDDIIEEINRKKRFI